MPEKQHYAVLDGLRGIAAISVVVFHLFESVYQDHSTNLFPHGFLAVDFFFCLSGFVLGYAYDDRAGKLSYYAFLKARLVRLHPLVILGTILGVGIYFLDPWGNYPKEWSIKLVLIPYLQSNFLIPTSIQVPNRFGNLFPFNPPSWSLSLEYLASIIYIAILWKLPRKILPILISLAGISLILLAHKFGTLSGGWHFDSYWVGVVRMLFSFLAGLTIKRYKLVVKNRIGYVLLCALLMVAFSFPNLNQNWLIELILIIIFFPIIISLGAGTKLTHRLLPFADFLGKISYPLYITHYWLISSLSNLYKSAYTNKLNAPLVIIGSTIFLILFAYLITRFYDEPLRRWLNKKLSSRTVAKVSRN